MLEFLCQVAWHWAASHWPSVGLNCLLDKLKAGSKFIGCRYGAATVQLLRSCLCFCCCHFPAPVAVSQCYSCFFKSIALSVLWLPDNCTWTGTSVCSGLWPLLSCCNSPSARLVLSRLFLWHVLHGAAHHPACKQPYFFGRCWAAVQFLGVCSGVVQL